MAKELSAKAIIAIAVGVSVSLAIGLGVGLGVGLKNEVIVYVTEPTDGSTTTQTPVTEPTDGSTTTQTPEDAPWLNYRLPDYIIPSRYTLSLNILMETNEYLGRIEMDFNVHKNSKYVLIHAHESLNIGSLPDLQWKNGDNYERWDIARTFRYPEYEFYVVESDKVLPAGEEFRLTLDFSNSLTDAFVGIFKSTYTDPGDGTLKSMVVSDMQPTNARRGYPCFDEPAMKVRFSTSILHEPEYFALSNMPVKSKDSVNNRTLTVFEESVPMSTYIACFIVCQFGYVEGFSKRGVKLRVYATPTQIANGDADYALEVTEKLLDEYEALLDMPYSISKYDQIAIPNLANFGAMENWGIVTFREDSLLWNRNDSSTTNRQRVASVIAHEMTHQWFGNIVTLSWWENLWLNEGFASYLEYRGLWWSEPEWLAEGHQVVDEVQRAMRADALSGSHPLKVNVSSPAQISEVFDAISYSKGSSVLKMMHDILGEDLFFGGLRYYLKDHEFGVANEQDLWKSVQRYVDENGGGFNVTELMDPWVQQRGYPLVSLRSNNNFTTQAIMLADSSTFGSLPDSPYDYNWNIKLDYYTANNATVKEISFPRTSDRLDIDMSDSGDWFKYNYKERGYYRLKYEQEIYSAHAQQLIENKTEIHQYDRSNLLDDAFNLASAGSLPYTTALNLTTYLNNEDSYFVWRAYSQGSSYIYSMLASTTHNNNFASYYLTRVKPIADQLGWDASEGTHEEKLNRPLVLGLALSYGDSDALAESSALFATWRTGDWISPDIRSLVYRYGIFNGDVSDWEYMLNRYMSEDVAGEKTNLLRGLAATEDIALIDRLLEYSKNDSIIKDQDFFSCISYISYTAIGNAMSWSWVRVNWDYMVERFGLESRGLGNIVPTIVENYNTKVKKWEVQSFFEANPEAGAGEAARENALLQIDLNIAWLATNEEPIGQWLQDRVDELPATLSHQ